MSVPRASGGQAKAWWELDFSPRQPIRPCWRIRPRRRLAGARKTGARYRSRARDKITTCPGLVKANSRRYSAIIGARKTQGRQMADNEDNFRELVADVAAAYFSNSHVGASDIPNVIQQIAASLKAIGTDQGAASD